MLELPDSWVWDFWFARDGDRYHLFFLYASRALHDPGRRHGRASIGHAVSDDLRSWTRVADALVHGDRPAFDDAATWTGSVVQGPDGTWHMFYTGASERDGVLIQSIGVARSRDLFTWEKYEGNPIVAADPRWYEKYDGSAWFDEAWRDPWVFEDPGGDGWHMLITGRANHGPVDDRGVVGHARSRDLLHWEVQPPLSEPGAGFGHLEVFQVEVVEGQIVLLFNCLRNELSAAKKTTSGSGGVWSLTADSATGHFDISKATPLTDDSLYVGRLVRDVDGAWVMLAFHNEGPDGFIGAISDPMPVYLTPDGLALKPA
ncbi:glycoside hydrolase family protein [Kribbella monticola]|uniref:glycosyl hydrolase family 32 n=1 Tax=Kribbella monticola TaxID=2185285 RepID=UPI000DD32C92|nr:glycosyl hydrolase family 32 [Kribbella monticola]